MKIDVIQLGMIRTNCYLISSEKAAIVIDPGTESNEALDFLNNNSEKERIILITHAHFDHIGGAEFLRNKTHVKIGIGINENPALSDTSLNLSDEFHAHIKPFCADVTFKDSEEYKIGDLNFKIIETPGHTKGGVSYLFNNKLFSGDTLFYESVGRTDFYGGDYKLLMMSVEKLLKLDKNIQVFPGHGELTTIEHEKKFNNNLF